METEIIAHTLGEAHSSPAEDIRGAFVSHREELKWLAGFLTANDQVADACVIDASAIPATPARISRRGLAGWTRFATISSAIEIQRLRIAQLAPSYERRHSAHRDERPLPPEGIELLVVESDLVQSRLDGLCRFVLILCGVERCSSQEAALLLGISRVAAQTAYCVARECLEIMHCQTLVESCGGYAAYN